MWYAAGNNLQMVEGDYGLTLPITISGVTLGASDSINITIKNRIDGDVILEKEYTNIQSNTIELVLTQAESELFPVGTYVYCLDWFQNNSFMCNIIRSAEFKVVNKA